MGETYETAGVSIAAGDESVRLIGDLVSSTADRPGAMGTIGGFGGLFDMAALGMRDPILVSATDGAGTKPLIARDTGRLDTVGIDLVAMCVDDLVCSGATPLFFLDYLSLGAVVPERVQSIVAGIATGCRLAGCALLGGETAEHPGAMEPEDFDMAGFAVGAVERDGIITGDLVEDGDVLVGFPSPGIRCNGYSLARRVLLDVAGRSLDDPAWEGADRTVADELLEPSVIYAPAALAAIAAGGVHAIAHITGGGLPGNIVRVLPATVDAVLDRASWDVPRIFDEIQRLGDIDDGEMAKVFNLGLGMVLAVAPASVADVLAAAAKHDIDARVVGGVAAGTGAVRFGPEEARGL